MTVALKDLAKACGVSVGTVSRALNDKSEVSKATAVRIKQLAKDLGYIPNRAGRALSSQKNLNCVGILLPSVNSPFFDDIKRGIKQARNEYKDLGLDIYLIEEEGWDPQKHLKAIENLEAHGCKAFALCTVEHEIILNKIKELHERNLPVLLINNDIPTSERICFVGPNYFKSGQVAAAMLNKCMHDTYLKILIVTGPKVHNGHQIRVDGFISELNRDGVKYHIETIIEGMDNDIITQQETMKAFQQHPEINCVYMATGSGVAGLGAAVIADREHHRFVIACDEIYTTRELVKSGIIDFVICQDSKTQGYQAIKKLHEYLIRTENETMDDYIVDNIIKIKNHFEMN